MKALSFLKSTLAALSLLLAVFTLDAQEFSAGINTESPNPNAVLHLVAPNGDQGLLIPSLSTAQRNAMSLTAADNGLMVFDSDENAFYFWVDPNWVQSADDQNLADVLSRGNDAGGVVIENAGEPINPQDVATKNYVDSQTSPDEQDLELDGNSLTLTNDPTSVDLSPFLDNTDSQNLSDVLAFGNDAGAFTITNLPEPVNPQDVATKSYVDNNAGGIQNLTLAGFDLNIDNGNSVDLSILQLVGDVTGTLGGSTVNNIGGQTAGDVASVTALINSSPNIDLDFTDDITLTDFPNLDTDDTDDLDLTTTPNAAGDISGDFDTGLIVDFIGGANASDVSGATAIVLSNPNLDLDATNDLALNTTPNAAGDISGDFDTGLIVDFIGGANATDVAGATSIVLGNPNLDLDATNDLTIGSNISDLTNDVGFILSGDNISVFNNDAGYITAESQDISTDATPGNINITGGSTLTLNVNDADNDPTNEIELPATAAIGDVLEYDGTSWVPGFDDIDDADNDPTNEIELPATAAIGDVLEYDGTSWVPGFDDIDDADNDPTNEIELPATAAIGDVLEYDGTSWVPGFDDIDDADNDPTNEIELPATAAIGDVLEYDGTSWVPGFDDIDDADNDPTNEIELPATAAIGDVLEYDGTSWVPGFDDIDDADNDPTNEIELPATAAIGDVLEYDGTNWIPGFDDIDDADNDPTNEIELPATAAIGDVLEYDGTNWVPGFDDIDDADNDPTNEIELPATAAIGDVLEYDGTNWIAGIDDGSTLLNGQIFIGDAGNVPQQRTLSGDVTIDNLGATTIANNAVTSAQISDATITNADIGAGAAIDGTKINPNFGAQNISTTGTISGSTINATSFVGDGNSLTNLDANSLATVTAPADGNVLMYNAGSWDAAAPPAILVTEPNATSIIGGSGISGTITGINNTIYGVDAAAGLSTGQNNTFVGKEAGNGSNASSNTFVGYRTGSTTTGGENVFVGFNTGSANTTGANNVFIGSQAGNTNNTGNFNVLIGQSADVGAAGLQNAIAIGKNAVVNANNAMVLGGTGADAVNVGIGTSTPRGPLDVQVGINSSYITGNSNVATGLLQIENAGAGDASIRFDTPGNNTVLGIDQTEGSTFKINMGSILTDGSAHFAITPAGNVGIGTATPGSTLDVNGTANIQTNLTVVGNTNVGGDFVSAVTGPIADGGNTASRIVTLSPGATINDLIGGVVGKEVILIATGGTTTINHNTGAPASKIMLNGAVNFIMNPNSTLHLVYISNTIGWLEIGRAAQ